ncbi:MAG: hypothetical protein JW797_12630 [Bradymonadales bacterium]|nr:hypothetical protein [Bradymonadales bacterium]
MPYHPDLSAEEIAAKRRLILRKLGDVAKNLEELLAGQEVSLLTIPLLGEPDPTWNKIERVRYYMKMLDGKVKALDAGDYGYCEQCANPIPVPELTEMPWADVCHACASKG